MKGEDVAVECPYVPEAEFLLCHLEQGESSFSQVFGYGVLGVLQFPFHRVYLILHGATGEFYYYRGLSISPTSEFVCYIDVS